MARVALLSTRVEMARSIDSVTEVTCVDDEQESLPGNEAVVGGASFSRRLRIMVNDLRRRLIGHNTQHLAMIITLHGALCDA
jgi:hypothetical protein